MFYGASVKNTNYQLHRDLIKDLDECMDPNQLASKCEWFRDRLGGRVPNALFNGRNRNRSPDKREKNCNRHNTDKPRDGKRDKKKHVDKNGTRDNANDHAQGLDNEEREKNRKKTDHHHGRRPRHHKTRHYNNKYDDDNKCATEQPATVYQVQEDTPKSADFVSSTIFH